MKTQNDRDFGPDWGESQPSPSWDETKRLRQVHLDAVIKKLQEMGFSPLQIEGLTLTPSGRLSCYRSEEEQIAAVAKALDKYQSLGNSGPMWAELMGIGGTDAELSDFIQFRGQGMSPEDARAASWDIQKDLIVQSQARIVAEGIRHRKEQEARQAREEKSSTQWGVFNDRGRQISPTLASRREAVAWQEANKRQDANIKYCHRLRWHVSFA